MTTAYRPLWPTPKPTKLAAAVRIALADGLMWAEQPARGGK